MDQDTELVAEATAIVVARYRPGWHAVGAALRLRNGMIFTGINLDATVGRIAVCAEAVALGRALTEDGTAEIEAIVAVYHAPSGAVQVVSPCGMCREMIADYAPEASVLLADGNGTVSRHPVADLLPHKFTRGAS